MTFLYGKFAKVRQTICRPEGLSTGKCCNNLTSGIICLILANLPHAMCCEAEFLKQTEPLPKTTTTATTTRTLKFLAKETHSAYSEEKLTMYARNNLLSRC